MKKFHILLADDDNDDRMFFTEALKGLGMQVSLTTFLNGVEVMEYLKEE